jgi:hypothetical protein
LGISIDLPSQLIDRVEAFFGRAGEPVAKVLLHLIVFVHVIQLDDLAIHSPIIPRSPEFSHGIVCVEYPS